MHQCQKWLKRERAVIATYQQTPTAKKNVKETIRKPRRGRDERRK